jgi:2-hydroxycyclohexanecarboxyl-CoA dehydrogenase
MVDLKGKCAIVTGGAMGIGRAIVDYFAKAGANVLIADINEDKASEAARELGNNVLAQKTDITDLTSVKNAVQKAINAFGKIDILVNNAGWDEIRFFLQTTPEFWDKVIAINYKGVLNTTFAVLPQMIEKKSGAIVNVASDAGRVGSSGEAVYAGCKAGVIAFSKTIAREHARDNIRVNVVCPGPTETPLFENLKRDETGAKILSSMDKFIPLRRLGKPDDLAPAVAFLASDEASFITGQVLSISGGLTMAG